MDDSAFLRQLDQDPDDDTTRLVYADWLDEHGDADRALFLRLQVQVRPLRYRHKGFSDLSQQLLRLGRRLDRAWLAVVSWPRLAGTCWSGHDTLGGRDTWRFLPGGVLNYTSETGTYENGTWWQAGNNVLMETNRHYADYQAYISGDALHGRARNINGSKWRWTAHRTSDPVECDPGDPDRSIYEHHGKRGRRRGARP